MPIAGVGRRARKRDIEIVAQVLQKPQDGFDATPVQWSAFSLSIGGWV